jgi:hypothetical protein
MDMKRGIEPVREMRGVESCQVCLKYIKTAGVTN